MAKTKVDHCTKCTNNVKADDKFCSGCGWQIVVEHFRPRQKSLYRAVITVLIIVVIYLMWLCG